MLSLQEYLMKDPLPRAKLHEAIFDFVRDADLVVFGAQAVNLYVPRDQVRMTADVDAMSPTPRETAKAMAAYLHKRFHLAMRVREAKPDVGFRVYHKQKGHLANIRKLDPSIPTIRQHGVRYVKLPALVAMKLDAYATRRNKPKGATDLADLRRLLLAHPELRHDPSIPPSKAWREILASPLEPDDD